MTNTKNTKRALLSSVLALFLCFAMLLGTTFAWFTDSVTSANNVIKSGNLDIALDYWDGDSWETVEGTNSLFTNNLWEPGHTEVVYLKLSNLGSLALKYQLAISVLSETEGTNMAGDPFKLSDYIQMGVVEGINGENNSYADRATAVEAVKANSGIIGDGYAKQGNMLAGDPELYMAVVVYMPETVGNVANAKTGTPAPTINLGVQVLATQMTAESDGFDNQYDEGATFGTYIELEAGADLLAAMATAEADKPLTIMLNGNVEWPTEGHHGENNITDASAITIIGNGNTITATGAGVTPLGDVEAPMTLKDVKIVDNSVSYNEAAWEFTYLEMGGTKLVCENVTFADEIQIGTNATFTNCSFESNEENVYAVWVEDGSASFTNCTFTGYRGLKVHEDYGTEVSSVIVKDCTFSDITKKPGIALGNIYMNGATYTSGGTTYTNTTDTTVSITGCTFINCQPGDQNMYIYESNTDVTTFKFVNENNNVVAIPVDASALKSALTANKKDIYVTLGADVDLPISSLGQITNGSGEYKLGGADTETITIDLNGKELNITTTYWSALGAVNPNATITIKNGSMTSTGNSAGTWNAWDLRFSNCNWNFEDVVFKKAVALDNAGKVTNMTNVTITDSHNTDTYALWITAEGQTVNIDGLTIDMLAATDGRGIKIDEQYVGTAAKVTLTVKNATFKTEEKSAILVKSVAGADITLENVDISGVAADTINAVWNDSDAAASFDKVTVTGGTKFQEQ